LEEEPEDPDEGAWPCADGASEEMRWRPPSGSWPITAQLIRKATRAPPRALPAMAATGFQRVVEAAGDPAAAGGTAAGSAAAGPAAPGGGGGGGSWEEGAVGGSAGAAVGGWSAGEGAGRGVSLMGVTLGPEGENPFRARWGVGEIIGG
jgi:hypothetical protein